MAMIAALLNGRREMPDAVLADTLAAPGHRAAPGLNRARRADAA